MDTEDQTLDMTETLKRFPVRLKRLEDVVRAQYISSHHRHLGHMPAG